ncbi:hypothetical protein FRC14_006023 [Serendipita sp. 396]|nr:hypothetical protein FRC14_006023 [Serendipita sp. 396]KAG8778777.1 hypothetical protein FRC15_010557 [Serendipita sp. 397]KAG8795890.1 hypothetical protein FRC16_009902 [Serendipita sp. 398]KAG8823086.1 hypothetical protein FRC18_010817 [Serendipita sp. 400]KAG8828105.1 hypothetical protein FRC19_009189 [Serendipita sp. 401]KAG8849167.1 hypothetical protein FRB91_010204 [Serendipita sp. 411]KAG8865058.1 hypothetical protein FRC20_009931 [Serendipita sp. 405]KAG9058410.1 hypothetical prot
MSFQFTSTNIALNGTILSANCQRKDGQSQNSTIDLNPLIGNINGQFQYGKSDFAQTSTDYGNLQIHGDGTIWLLGTLQKEGGGSDQSTINLSDHIANTDGTLQAVN